jgi:hypothetical protein
VGVTEWKIDAVSELGKYSICNQQKRTELGLCVVAVRQTDTVKRKRNEMRLKDWNWHDEIWIRAQSMLKPLPPKAEAAAGLECRSMVSDESL